MSSPLMPACKAKVLSSAAEKQKRIDALKPVFEEINKQIEAAAYQCKTKVICCVRTEVLKSGDNAATIKGHLLELGYSPYERLQSSFVGMTELEISWE